MKNQIIITIGREYGSAGHYIAQTLSKRLGIELYDRTLLENAVKESGFSDEELKKYDEKPVNVFLSRKIGNYSNSIEEIVAEKVFDFLKQRAAEGQSFIAVGRCSEYILRGNPNMLSIFVLGDMEDKKKRIMEIYGLSEQKAEAEIKKHDKKRKMYHNYYSDIKWGDSRGYDLSVNSSKFGIDKTVELLLELIDAFKHA